MPALTVDCEGFRTADVVATARGPKSEVEPEDQTEWLQSRVKNLSG